MKFLHLLARVNDDNWAGYVGSYVLLGFGPATQQAIREALRTLRERPEYQSIDVAQRLPVDCSARQIPAQDGLMTEAVEQLLAQVAEADHPVPVPDGLLRDVLLLADEFDELRIKRLPVYVEGGVVEVTVSLPDVLRGREFLLAGQLVAKDLPDGLGLAA